MARAGSNRFRSASAMPPDERIPRKLFILQVSSNRIKSRRYGSAITNGDIHMYMLVRIKEFYMIVALRAYSKRVID